MCRKIQNKIKLLCKLGFTRQLFIRFLLPELKKTFSADAFAIVQINREDKVVNIYDSDITQSFRSNFFPVACNEHKEKKGKSFWKSTSQLCKILDRGGVISSPTQLFFESFVNSSVADVLDYKNSLIACVVHDDDAYDLLIFNRKECSNTFNSKDIRVFSQLLPQIKEGLEIEKGNGVENCELTKVGDAGLAVFNADGENCRSNFQGAQLLQLAAYSQTEVVACNGGYIPLSLGVEIKKFANDKENSDGNMRWEYSNEWGDFVFRGSWLYRDENLATSLIAVEIDNLVPLPFKVLNRCIDFELTTKQTDICLQLVKGNSYNDIGKEMYISSHTVIDHVRKMYQKFNVASRAELITKLTVS